MVRAYAHSIPARREALAKLTDEIMGGFLNRFLEKANVGYECSNFLVIHLHAVTAFILGLI